MIESTGFSIHGREIGDIKRAAVVPGDSWNDWPPVSFAKNDHILVWWLPEYDEALRQLVAEYQWAWRRTAFSHLQALIPEAVLRAWRDSDPLCREYQWQGVLQYFAVARAKQLGLSFRPAAQKACSCCSSTFTEDGLPDRFIARLGINEIDVCQRCLGQALDVEGSKESTPETVTAVLQALSAALHRPPRTSDLTGRRLDLRGLTRDARAAAVQALRVKPTITRVRELFESWEAALAHAAAAPPVPLPEYQSPPPSPAAVSQFVSSEPDRYRSLMGPVPDVVLDGSREPSTYLPEIYSLMGAGYLALAEAALTKLCEPDYPLFSYLLAQVLGQTARAQEAGMPGPRDIRTITSGPSFYEPLPSLPRGNVCFVLVGGPMEYVDLRGEHSCVSGVPPQGGAATELAESVARMSAMVDGELWMQAAIETGQAIIASLSRARMVPRLYGHLICYMTTPFRQIVKALTGSAPKKVAEDAWSIGPVGKSRWSYQREAAHYLFNASAGFNFMAVEAAPAVCIWGWPDRSDGCLQAFLDTVTVGAPEPVTAILPDVPAYRDFARRYVRGQRMANSERTLIEDGMYYSATNRRGCVLAAEFAPRLVIHPDGKEDDSAQLTGAMAYLDAHHTLRLSVWDVLRDGLLREAAMAASTPPKPRPATVPDRADIVRFYGQQVEYYEKPEVRLGLFRPGLLDAVTSP